MTIQSFQHWYRYHHLGRPIKVVQRFSDRQGIIEIPVLATGPSREGYLEPFQVTSTRGGDDLSTKHVYNGTETTVDGEPLLIWIYCGLTVQQAKEYKINPPQRVTHQTGNRRGKGIYLPTTWVGARAWLAEKHIDIKAQQHMASLDPLTIGMKGVIHNYYYIEVEQDAFDEKVLLNVPHKYNEENSTWGILIKAYGYTKKADRLDRVLNKALTLRDEESCIDYAAAFLERPVKSVDMSKVDFKKPATIINAAVLFTSPKLKEEAKDDVGEDMAVSLPDSYDF